ncbi:helix-turn-helix domain-containing protein [Streptomyces sp. NBC_01304]|uniref:helix-turn-helix domain-containing protein n=1 Tax=Streptomyces sp. NBC_01304 TaxID=2903818 RepID=UPI002E0ED4B6|nr:helix-turn-helix transcriptional regulator [Streptomyces sp. NBC_01304]
MTEVNAQQPPIAWRYCGSQIKLSRTEKGISRQTLADEASYDYEYVKSMENGRRRPTLRLLQAADQLCGAKGKLVAAHEYMKPEPFPARSQEYMAVEAEAIAVHHYALGLVPGLLQTKGYAEALIGDGCPPLDDETVAERVAARLRRQEALTRRASVVFSFVVYEAALRSMVGNCEVMRQQLEHLLAMSVLRNVSVQALPVGRCSGVALLGSLVMLETADHQHYGYVEGHETSVLYSDAAKVSALAARHAMIRTHALSVEESTAFIRKVAQEL